MRDFPTLNSWLYLKRRSVMEIKKRLSVIKAVTQRGFVLESGGDDLICVSVPSVRLCGRTAPQNKIKDGFTQLLHKYKPRCKYLE